MMGRLEWRRLLLVPLAALFAVHPLIVHGCSCGHDFDFHLLSWMEVATQTGHGNLHPHWAFTPAFNAGEPRFVFYPPVSWYLGALLGIVLTHLPGVSEAAAWSAVPIVFTWIALTLAGLTMYRLAREFAGEGAALVGAILYLANPYMLFTAFERTAYGELLAAAWIPLLLLGLLRVRVTVAGIAVPLALLWLTNAPAAVMGMYTLGIVAAVRLSASAGVPGPMLDGRRDRSMARVAVKVVAGTSLGLGLAAFYLLPAVYERRFVQVSMATIGGMRIDQNFLFEHTGVSPDAMLHDAVLHTASTIAVILLAATVVVLAAVAMGGRGRPGVRYLETERAESALPILPLGLLTAAIGFSLTRWSGFLWRHAPEASLLQFPWRLLAVLAPVLALVVAHALGRARGDGGSSAMLGMGRRGIAPRLLALAALAGLTISAYYLFRQDCDPEDTAAARLALFHSNAGTDPTDEYTPTTADNDALAAGDPPYWVGGSADAPPPAAMPGAAPGHLTVSAPRAEVLVLNLREYPAWRVTLNGVSIAPGDSEERPDGLIAVRVPAGTSSIDIHYAQMLDQTLGDGLSLIALALGMVAFRGNGRGRSSGRPFAVSAGAV